MKQIENVISRCRELLANGAELDSVLRELRDAGYSKVQSIKALVDLDQASFAEAKIMVHESTVWKDVFERDSDFQDVVAEALNDHSKRCE